MKKYLPIFAVLTVLMQLTLGAPAYADETVRVTSDGKIINKNGDVIAVQNAADSQNDDYNKYYSNVDETGRSSGKSDFYVVSDPDKGFVRKEINLPSALPAAPTATKDLDFTPFQNSTNSLTTTPSASAAISAKTTTITSLPGVHNMRFTTITRPQNNGNNSANFNANSSSANNFGANNSNASNPKPNSSPGANAANIANQAPNGVVAKPMMVDAPQRSSPSDSVYGSVTETQTLYGQ